MYSPHEIGGTCADNCLQTTSKINALCCNLIFQSTLPKPFLFHRNACVCHILISKTTHLPPSTKTTKKRERPLVFQGERKNLFSRNYSNVLLVFVGGENSCFGENSCTTVTKRANQISRSIPTTKKNGESKSQHR